MKFRYFNIAILFSITLTFIHYSTSVAQETNSNVSGIVKSDKNVVIEGAIVRAVHEPTQNTYLTVTRKNGNFYFSNLKPGGPYSIFISFSGYETFKRTQVYLNLNSTGYFLELNENELITFTLKEKQLLLQEVLVNAVKKSERINGSQTSINKQHLNSLPTISRNLQDFVRLVPQSKVNGDGMMSLAGQNNKFNAFFIDGANNNDILGIALSGTNGGQTGTPPVSIDALEEIKVLLSPYNVEYSNFTGGSINAITKSGSNTFKSAAWYLFRNEQMAGRSPVIVNSSTGLQDRTRLSDFFNQTAGIWASGPVIKNKLFYFVLLENQSELQPQPIKFSEYLGNSTVQEIGILIDTLRSKYKYEPGSFLETSEQLNATRFLFKADWNQSLKNKFTITYRYNFAEKQAPQSVSSRTVIRFQRNGYIFPARTHAATFEWKKYLKKDISNRMLFTFTNQFDDRKWIGQPFPYVSILDGSGTIFFGSNNLSQLTQFRATDITLINTLKFIKQNHNVTTGFDFNYKKLNDLIIPGYFGNYQFKSLNDFISGLPPSRFQRSFPLIDSHGEEKKMAGANYKTSRLGFYINDEIHFNPKLRINFGLRLDGNTIYTSFRKDDFFNDTAFSILSNYYDLENAKTGKAIRQHWQLSPRVGFAYKIPTQKITVLGGMGIFTGHILNIWVSNLLSSAIGYIDIDPSFFGLTFNSNPYNQPDFQTLGINADNSIGGLALLSKKYKYPTVFRSSFSIEKKIKSTWAVIFETIFSKNIHETKYTNVNILPPTLVSASPGERNVYSLNNNPVYIPLYSNGRNPYSNIILQSNNHGQKGYSYSFSVIINKKLTEKFDINASYNYGHSLTLFEPTGTAGPIDQQWRQSETVNGKNYTKLSLSDFDYGHKVSFYLTRYFKYANNNISTTISFLYTGQSGNRFSYVYNGSLVNDNGKQENFDLIYIPTKSDLSSMTFIPNTVGGITYSEQQQKDLFNQYIENDNYLKKHRGQFAERNGSRLPFTHIIDLRIQQNFIIKRKRGNFNLNITYDVFNFTNMLNKKWGRIYFLSFDNYPIVKIAGYANANVVIPQYQYTPFTGNVYSIQNSTAPGNSARWISQLGLRISLN